MLHPYALAARAAHYSRLARLGGFLLLLAWLLPGAARAQGPAWAGATPGSLTQANGTSITRAVATDASGNVFVTGYFTGSVAFGSTLLTSLGSNDLFIAKYVPGTGTWAWAQSGGGTSNDIGYGVAVSGSSVYVTGTITNTTANTNGVLFGGTGTTAGTVQQNGATSTSSADIVLTKYTDNGSSAALGWTQVGGGTGSDIGTGVAVSGSSVYVTGQITNSTGNTNTVLFGGTGTTAGTVPQYGASASSIDLVLAKYTDNGTTGTFGWSQVGGGTGTDFGQGVVVSGSSVYVTGQITNSTGNTNTVLFGGTGTTAGTVQVNGATSNSSADIVLTKYTDNGTTGTLGWTQVGGGTGSDLGQGVAVSGSSVYVTGYITNNTGNGSTVLFGGTGTTAGTVQQNGASSSSSQDLVLAKYTDNGPSAALGWTQVGGGTGGDIALGVAASGSSVYVTGQLTNDTSNSSTVLFGGTGTTAGTVQVNGASSINGQDLVLAKYTDNGTTGTLGWTQVGGGTGGDFGQGVALSGSSVVAGGYLGIAGTAAFGAATGAPVLGTIGNRAVLALADAGTGTWQALALAYNGGTSITRAVATDASGNVFVTGYFTGQVDFGSTRLTSVGNNDLFVAKYVFGTGTWAWAQSGGGTSNDIGYGIAVSGSSVYVTGYITNTTVNTTGVLFGGTGTTAGTVQVNGASSSNSQDLVLAKYTDNGPSAALGWTQVGGGTGTDIGYGIAVSGGSVYVTGQLFNSTSNTQGVLFGGTGTTAGTVPQYGATSSSSNDLVLAKYTDNGPSAALGWTQVGGGTGTDIGYGVAVSGSSVYVTGQLFNSTSNTQGVLFGGTGTTAGTVPQYGATSSSSNDLVLAKYTDNGPSAALGWTQVGGGTGTDIGYGVAVSGSSVYVTGQLTNSTANTNGVRFGGTGTTAGTVPQYGASTSNSGDLILAKYTDNGTTGTFGWSQVGGGTSNDIGYGVAASGSSVYVTGQLANTTVNGNGVLFGGTGTTAGTVQVNGASGTLSADLVLAKYTDNGTTGTFGWSQVGGGTGADFGYGVALSGQNVLAAGSVTPSASFGSYTIATPVGANTNVLAYLTIPPPPAITGFSPTSGVAGTPVALTGTNLSGATSVTVNGVAVTPTAVTATSLTFVVPAGASATQSITVTAFGSTSPASTAFTVRLTTVATGTSPAPNAVTAPVANSALAVGFTEPVSAASAATLKVFSAQAGGLKAGTVTSSGSTARYTSSLGAALRDFRAGETVSVSVPATVQGAGGLALSAPTVYQFTTATAASFGTFAGRTDFGAGTAPYGVALGDVSGDGILDLVVVNDGSASASVLLGTGTGTGSFGAKTDYATGTQPDVVALGDVNGDGRLDIVTANYGSSNVSVLLNQGSGTFGAKTDYATGTNTRSVALGDVNGDGRLDIVTATYGGSSVTVLLGTGTPGSFGGRVDYATGTNPAGITLGDVDGDGALDIVTANFGGASLSVLLGSGTGTFGPKADYGTGTNPATVALGDLNGDGKLDVVASNFSSNTTTVLLNTGTGTFGSRVDYATAANPLSVALGDVNGDGTLDLATANYGAGSASLLLGTGTGTFGTKTDYATGSTPAGVALADLNGDGTLDLATANNGSANASVLLGLTPPAVLTAVAPNPGGLGQAITLTGTNLAGPTALTINGANALGNIISNTGTSLVVRVPVTAAASGNVSISNLAGTSSLPFTVMAPPGNALAFDGVNDYLALPSTTPVPLGNTAYTVEAWINANSMNLGSIIGWGNYGTTDQANGLSLTSTGLINYWWAHDLEKATPNLVGRWHHVAATYDGTTRTLYLDGVALGSDVPGMHAVPNAQNLRIGSNSNGAFTYLNGRLDEVRVYSVALTPAQLQADMVSTTAAVPASLVLYYNFDQGTPATASTGDNAGLTTLYDLSNNATPGTLTNFALVSGNTTSNYVQSYALVVPVVITSTARTATGFTVNWLAPTYGTATSYLLDVSTTPDFASPVAGSPFATTATSYPLTGLNSSSAYFYRVRALNSALATPDQGDYSNVVSQTTPLPVELTAFTATASGPSAVRLAWATASEKNSFAFEVERSTDGRAFAPIGTVAAAGSSSSARSYELLDGKLPGAALLYYRLKQVDADGSFSYSPVRVVGLKGAAEGLSLYPNPATTGATLTGALPGTVVTVFDALGRLVTSASADASGTAALALPAGLPAGVYVVRAGSRALRLTVE